MFGIILPILITFPAVVLWISEKQLYVRFANSIAAATSIGQILGIAGMCLFIYTIVFATRPKFLEDKFGGLDKIYKSHHQIGVVAWVLLLLHPLALSFVSGDNFPVGVGEMALFMMSVLLVLTIFIRPTFKVWKMTHKFLSLALLLGMLHTFLVGSDVSIYLPLKIYMLFLFLIGVISIVYQIWLSDFIKVKYEFKVNSIKIKNKIVDITLTPINNNFDYEPGQFVFIKFISDNIPKESHPFSIAPADDGNIRIIVKLQGDYTNLLEKLQVGTKALIEGPYGKFADVKLLGNKQIWIAGGIGVVPFLSMEKNIKTKTDIYYLVRNEPEALYLDELSKNANKDIVKVIPYYSEESGHINLKKIENISGNLSGADIFICGPKNMTESLVREMKKNGVKNNRIHFELFEY